MPVVDLLSPFRCVTKNPGGVPSRKTIENLPSIQISQRLKQKKQDENIRGGINSFMKYFLILLFLLGCKDKEVPEFGFGLSMDKIFTDTNGNGKNDAVGYFVNNPKDYRIVYQEHDTNENGKTDLFIWSGFSAVTVPDRPEKETVKVHEAEDTDHDGKVDLLRWLLPNGYIALTQTDNDKDGYFETTNYFNRHKKIVRTEVDTNKDGTPDKIYWEGRVEVDTDFDGYPDHLGLSDSETELRKMNKENGLKPMDIKKSWSFNPELVPKFYRPILQIQE